MIGDPFRPVGVASSDSPRLSRYISAQYSPLSAFAEAGSANRFAAGSQQPIVKRWKNPRHHLHAHF